MTRLRDPFVQETQGILHSKKKPRELEQKIEYYGSDRQVKLKSVVKSSYFEFNIIVKIFTMWPT